MSKSKATEDQFNSLHNMVTELLIQRLNDPEVSTADIKAAIDWLVKNDITGTSLGSNPLSELERILPKIDYESIQTRVNSR